MVRRRAPLAEETKGKIARAEERFPQLKAKKVQEEGRKAKKKAVKLRKALAVVKLSTSLKREKFLIKKRKP